MNGAARGSLCGQCRSGLAHREEKTFDPRCKGCQVKLANGLRTGNEPLPKKGPPVTKYVDHARMRLQKAARAKYYASLPSAS